MTSAPVPAGDRPWRVLTRHFFNALFDFGIFSEAGTEAFKRALGGLAAVFLALGLLLLRIFAKKYAILAGAHATEGYQLALITDHSFLMAVPMWIVAFAVVLVGHALFPDERDYRILMTQPVSRRTIFAAKLLALLLFAGLFVAGTHLALAPLAALTMMSSLAPRPFVTQALVFELTSLAASVLAALSIVAVHGLLVLAVPRARLAAFSTFVRSALVSVLVLSLPLVGRLPGAAGDVAAHAWWMAWAPPMWFVALERWLAGGDERLSGSLALAAPLAMLFVLLVSVAAYGLLYRRFDRVILRSQSSRPPGRRSVASRIALTRPARLAIRRFASLTLRRSVLHQGIVVALSAVAVGLVVNAALSSDLDVQALAFWAPFPLMFVVSRAVRLALALPIEVRANWVFRMTDALTTRSEATGAAVATVLRLGVALPVAAIAPLHWLTFGPAAILMAIVAGLIGWLHAELLLQDWRRIPFTCSYMPGKGFVPQIFLKTLFFFLFFTTTGSLALRLCLVAPAAALVVGGTVAAAASTLAVRRRRLARVAGLEFEDSLPNELNVLRLNVD